jgi:hypothetical protein
MASAITNTRKIRQPRPKQPNPFLLGGASTQVFMDKAIRYIGFTIERFTI